MVVLVLRVADREQCAARDGGGADADQKREDAFWCRVEDLSTRGFDNHGLPSLVERRASRPPRRASWCRRKKPLPLRFPKLTPNHAGAWILPAGTPFLSIHHLFAADSAPVFATGRGCQALATTFFAGHSRPLPLPHRR